MTAKVLTKLTGQRGRRRVDGEFLIKPLPVSGAAHDSAGSTDDERGPLDQEAAHQIHQTACDLAQEWPR